MTLTNRAVQKIVDCIDSSKTHEHMDTCNRMIQLIYNYDVKSNTLTYLTTKYRDKLLKIDGEV